MKIKNCVLATLLLAVPSITFAVGAEFDGKLYAEVKAKATKAAQSENVPAASKPAEVKNGNPANQKVNAFTVSDLAEIMNAEDYNTFLDSLVIKEGRLICADNKTLWKYAENETVRYIGLIVSERYENRICLNNTDKKEKDVKEIIESITFVNGNVASWTENSIGGNYCSGSSPYNFICLKGKKNLRYGELCMKKFINGHECRKHNKTDVCDNDQCGMSSYEN